MAGRITSAQRYGLIGAAVVLAGSVAVNVPKDAPPVEQPVVAVQGAAVEQGEAVFRDGFDGEGGGGAPVPPDPTICPPPPAGFSRVEKTWAQAFTYNACTRPNQKDCERNISTEFRGPGYPVPVGTDAGTYVTVRFTPNAGESVNLYWDQVQARPQIGYTRARPGPMYFALGPCPGDFTAPDPTSANLWHRPACRKFEYTASIIWGASSTPIPDLCTTPAGVPIYLSFIPADPAGGIHPGETACQTPAQNGCEVGARPTMGPIQ